MRVVRIVHMMRALVNVMLSIIVMVGGSGCVMVMAEMVSETFEAAEVG